MALTPSIEASAQRKAFCGLQKCTQERKLPQVNLSKVVEAPLVAKPRSKAEISQARNSAGVVRNVVPPKCTNDEIPRHKTTKLPPEVNGNSSCSNHLHLSQVADDHVGQNRKDSSEYLRGFPPGFDVRVDDELRDPDYYHGEDQFEGNIP
ncbi:hypothetical protein POTOM_016282 [Populus tomentosa]|uniref:Uncharacterized protein n=1 Tax=Populus tomentosa TaxID=118781 RepID=A0A8X8A3G1_POPTO|nr:hypothetical protein POTOM_016282 [Populus tomentosa]